MNKPSKKATGSSNRLESMSARAGFAPVAPAHPARPSLTDGVSDLPGAGLIELGRIMPDYNQPRDEFDDAHVQAIADSMRSIGQTTPCDVRWNPAECKYVLITGENRYKAAKRAGIEALMCIVVDDELTDADVLERQVVENLLRANLKPMEQARAYERLIATRGCTVEALGRKLGIGHPAIVKSLALLKTQPDVQAEVEAGTLAPSVAYEVGKIADPDAQVEVARRIVAGKLNREQAVGLVREQVAAATEATPAAPPKPGAGGPGIKRVSGRRAFDLPGGVRVTVQSPGAIDGDGVLAALLAAVEAARPA